MAFIIFAQCLDQVIPRMMLKRKGLEFFALGLWIIGMTTKGYNLSKAGNNAGSLKSFADMP
jgi:hypothetical protein